MRTKLLLIFVVIAILGLNSITIAQEQIYTLASLTKSSDAIIQGKVISIKYYEKEPGRIYSIITIKVEETIKGIVPKDHEITLEHLGGVLGEIRQIVPQLPQFVENEKSILFLKRYTSEKNPMGFYDLLGSSQGKFNIITDDSNNINIVRDHLVVEDLKLDDGKQELGINNKVSFPDNLFMQYVSNYLVN